MLTVSLYEAKTHLSRLVDDVAAGRTIVITRHGVPVAQLSPATPGAGNPADVIQALREASRGVRRGRTSIRRMIEEGRR